MKVFNDLIDTIEERSKANKFEITNVKLFCKAWRKDLETERRISIEDIYRMASMLKHDDFMNWISKELYNTPSTVDNSENLKQLYLYK